MKNEVVTTLHSISQQVEKLNHHNFWYYAVPLSTGVIAILIALFQDVAVDYFFHKNKLKLASKNMSIIKQSAGVYYRIPIVNTGYRAIDVEADIVKVIHSGKEAEHTLPLPLEWTHEWVAQGKSKIRRTIHKNQIAFLDLAKWHGSLDLLSPPVMDNPTYSHIETGKTQLHIIFFMQSGQTFYLKINVDWKNKNNSPDIVFDGTITELKKNFFTGRTKTKETSI